MCILPRHARRQEGCTALVQGAGRRCKSVFAIVATLLSLGHRLSVIHQVGINLFLRDTYRVVTAQCARHALLHPVIYLVTTILGTCEDKFGVLRALNGAIKNRLIREIGVNISPSVGEFLVRVFGIVGWALIVGRRGAGLNGV